MNKYINLRLPIVLAFVFSISHLLLVLNFFTWFFPVIYLDAPLFSVFYILLEYDLINKEYQEEYFLLLGTMMYFAIGYIIGYSIEKKRTQAKSDKQD